MQSTRIHNLGTLLLEAREDKQLSVTEVCNRLKLRASIITSLEANDYANLPAAAFVRGYLRSYAILLELDPAVILAEYNRLAPADPVLVKIESEQYARSKAPLIIFWGTAILGVVLVALMVVWGLNHLDNPTITTPQISNTIPSNTEEISAQVTDEVMEPVDETQINADVASLDITADKSKVANLTNAVKPASTPSVVATATPKPVSISDVLAANAEKELPRNITPIAPAGSDRLVIIVTGRSWVDIKDANGYTLIYEMMTESSGRAVLQGQAPFEFVLGNAPDVGIEVNGVSFDQSRFTKNNASAKFTVSAPR